MPNQWGKKWRKDHLRTEGSKPQIKMNAQGNTVRRKESDKKGPQTNKETCGAQ